MTHVCLDANILISLYNFQDSNHQKVVNCLKAIEQETSTFHLNDLLVTEILTVLLLKTKDLKATKHIHQRLHSGLYHLHPFTDRLKSLSLDIFLSQTKPRLSVADASLIALCKTLRTKHLFTLDHNLIAAASDYQLTPIEG